VREPDVADLLARHFALMRAQSPAESCHVLPASELESADTHLYALRQSGALLAVGAIRVAGTAGELKSMHTREALRGRGLGRRLLQHLIAEAGKLGLARLDLETGSGPEHAAARALYISQGFEVCSPFGSYSEDPLSLFMTRAL
jgi:putative acetyltransferase